MIIGGGFLTQCIRAGRLTVFRYEDDGVVATNPPNLRIGPNSIDVTLAPKFLRSRARNTAIDPTVAPRVSLYESGRFPLELAPGAFILGAVRERFVWPYGPALPELGQGFRVAPMIEGRSTLARLGVTVHATAGFGDVGFEGNFTLEIANISNCAVLLQPGARIAQVYFVAVADFEAEQISYSGAYSTDHDGAVPVAPRLGAGRLD